MSIPNRARVAKAANDSLALTNCLVVNKSDFPAAINAVSPAFPALFNCLSYSRDSSCLPGEVGTSAFHRRWASLSLAETVNIQPFDPFSDGQNCYLSSITLEVGFLRKTMDIQDEFDTAEMSKAFATVFQSQVFTKGQILVFEFRGINLMVVVNAVQLVDIDALKKGSGSVSHANPDEPGSSISSNRGLLMPQTNIVFLKSPDSTIRLKGNRSVGSAIINPDFKFEDLGIGGLDSEFSSIFRRAFASRIFPPSLVKKLGIQHVRGLLLYGPPGTGKTLMARQIGKMLNAKEPKIVNGPEILNKFVGQSEENIRKLFKEAELDYKSRGDDSDLHIIIFDEIDAICKQRGSKNDGTGVGDSIVNQLLSKLDGVEQLNNILVIGMTNRLDMIDEALLRPGRLEVHMEIHLPDEGGRLQIIKIHTSKMRDNNVLDSDVDISELSQLTKNYSGAEIAGLVKSASSFAFNRHVKVGSLASVETNAENLKVCRADFIHALDEVRPAFGVSEGEMKACVRNGIIHYSPTISRMLGDGQLFVEQVRSSNRTPLVSVLLHGPPGSGKTALAATVAMSSEFPFIKLISPDTMVGFSESAKMSAITKVFNDSYKSPFSVIVIDCIERLLDYVPIGPRFSNGVLQTILVLLKKNPPKDRKLLVLATTSQKSLLEQMDTSDAFNADIYVSNITKIDSMDKVLQDLKVFSEEERAVVRNKLIESGIEKSLSIGVKKLLMIAEMARQDADKVSKFVSTIQDECQSMIIP